MVPGVTIEPLKHADPLADDNIAALLSRAVADAEQVARSEIELQKVRLLAKVDEAKVGVALAFVALMLVSLATTAIVVGALLTLTPLVGPLGATGIVVGVLLVLAALCGWLALGRFKLMFAPKAKP